MEILFYTCKIFYFIVYIRIIITTINNLIERFSTSVGHVQVTVRIIDILVVYLLTCQWMVYGMLCVVVCSASSLGVFLFLRFVFSFV